MTPFGKYPDRGLKSLADEAVRNALSDAGAAPADIEMAAVGNAVAGLITGQECIRGQVVLRQSGIGEIPIINVENACAGASTAFHVAWQAVSAGSVDIALAVGVEKLTHPDKAMSLKAFSAAVDVEQMQQIQQRVNAVGRSQEAAKAEAAAAEAEGGKPKRSMFMDIYAASVRAHMQRYGTTKEQMAKVAVKSHKFGSLNPYAQYRNIMSLEEVLDDVPVSDPLTRAMCSPIGDGAAAAVLMSEAAAARLGFTDRPRVLASVLTSATLPDTGHASAEQRAIRKAYEVAAVDPSDLDVVEVHDATSPAELLAYEDIGLCAPGDSGKLIDTGATDLGGTCPVNTSGGLVSRGHPVGATGLAQIAELYWQLRGQCGDRQVDGAKVGLAQNGGGFMGNDSAAQAVTILAR